MIRHPPRPTPFPYTPPSRSPGTAYNSNPEPPSGPEPEAPAASVTVTRTVKLRGRMMTYVSPAVNEPWLVALPVVVEPSPQSIVYDHGPLLFASVKLQLSV